MDTDDPAKGRAEARAERELQLKIETLELERDKFQYTKRQSNRDRMSAAGTRAAGAFMFAHGSMIVVSLTNYKALADLISVKELHQELVRLGLGLVVASLGFVGVLLLGAVASFTSQRRIRVIWGVGTLLLCLSFGLFVTVLENTIRALAGL